MKTPTTLEKIRKGGLFQLKCNMKRVYIKGEKDLRTGHFNCRKILCKNDRFLWNGNKTVYPLSTKEL